MAEANRVEASTEPAAPELGESDVKSHKKRGRKKKAQHETSHQEEIAPEQEETSAEMPPVTTVDEEAAEKVAKKKRGRPRKSAQLYQPEEEHIESMDLAYKAPDHSNAGEQEGDHIEEQVPALNEDVEGEKHSAPPPKKRGKKKKNARQHDDDEVKKSANTSLDAAILRNASGNSNPTSKTLIENTAENPEGIRAQVEATEGRPTETRPVKDDVKEALESLKPSQPGRALYRVGLSKKSRIAPLLKIIRK